MIQVYCILIVLFLHLRSSLFLCRKSAIVTSCGGWPVGGCWNTRGQCPPVTLTTAPRTPRGRAWCWTLTTSPPAPGGLFHSPSGRGTRGERPPKHGGLLRSVGHWLDESLLNIYYLLFLVYCWQWKCLRIEWNIFELMLNSLCLTDWPCYLSCPCFINHHHNVEFYF